MHKQQMRTDYSSRKDRKQPHYRSAALISGSKVVSKAITWLLFGVLVISLCYFVFSKKAVQIATQSPTQIAEDKSVEKPADKTVMQKVISVVVPEKT